MGNRTRWTCALILLATCAGATAEGAAPVATNPCHGRQTRQEVFEFAAAPTAARTGDGWTIRFASKAACDATVAVVDKDGRVVRHLASGVLGANAPWPFRQDSLAQSIEWDGKDDAGKPAAAGCKVKVGLGLTAAFDKALGWSPDPIGGGVIGLGVDSAGEFYVLQSGAGKELLKVFDRQGRYLRTLLPPPASASPETAPFIDWQKTTFGRRSIAWARSGSTSNWAIYNPPAAFMMSQPTRLVLLADGRLVALTPQLNGLRHLILLDSKNGMAVEACMALVDKPGAARNGSNQPMGLLGCTSPIIAASPDGKALYVGGSMKAGALVSNAEGRNGPSQAVSRISLEKPAPAERFAGDYTAPGSDDTHFDSPTGVACDKDGNVYVADWGNDRVQVFKPDGTLLKSIPADKPVQLAVHPKSGAIYVLSHLKLGDDVQAPGGRRFIVRLAKLAGLASPTPVATRDLAQTQFPQRPILALDYASEPPAAWVSWGSDVWRIEDRGEAFEKTLSLKDVAAAAASPGWEKWAAGGPEAKHCYVAADPLREEIYVRESGTQCFPSPTVLRVDGRTGKVISKIGLGVPKTNFKVEQVDVSWDGKVYMRLNEGGSGLACYDPDADKFVPFAHSEPLLRGPNVVTYKGETVAGIRLTGYCAARTFPDIFAVAPDGDLYVPCGVVREHIEALAKANEPQPKLGGPQYQVLQVFSPDGTLKSLSALPGLGISCGVRVGRGGAVYVQLPVHPIGQKLPDGLAPDAKYSGSMWGTLVKFNGRGLDKFPVGAIVGYWEASREASVDNPTHLYDGRLKVRLDNAAWSYGGALVTVGGGCTCSNSTFALDPFERSFIPALHTCTVNVLDANGNVVARLGGYGNTSDVGPDGKPAFSLIWPHSVAVTDEAVYVHDMVNARVVRARLLYKAEAAVPVP